MTLHVTEILGRSDESRFAGRRMEGLPIAWDEASKRRFRRETRVGTDVTVDLPRGSYLAEGDVLFDDGTSIVVIERVPERALVVRFDPATAPERLIAQALTLGHAFGNQHAPVDLDGLEARMPLTTSEEIARATVESLQLDAVEIEVADVALGRQASITAGHSHADGHQPRHEEPPHHPHEATAADADRPAAAQPLLAALQLSDSALPIGRFVHSSGLEAWLHAHEDFRLEDLHELVAAVVCEGIATLDGAALAHAHRARSLVELVELDKRITARKLTPPSRAASHACGRQLAALARELVPESLADDFAALVGSGEADGNLAVVQGALSRVLGISVRDAVLVELRGTAASLLSAAVRLGRLPPVAAQRTLLGLHEVIAAAADRAIRLEVDDFSSTTPELEIFALIHRRADARLFST